MQPKDSLIAKLQAPLWNLTSSANRVRRFQFCESQRLGILGLVKRSVTIQWLIQSVRIKQTLIQLSLSNKTEESQSQSLI